jgi:hypothetical protein
MNALLDHALVLLENAVLTALGAALTAAFAYFISHAKSERAKRVLGAARDLSMTVVRQTYQAYVKPLKETGDWSEEKHGLAKQQALLALKSYLGQKGLLELGKVAAAADLDGFLGALIDEMVHNNKLLGESVKAGASANPLPPLQ